MNRRDLSLCAGLLAATLALLGGCALPIEERHLSPGLLAPQDVPKEKWSDAMLVMEAMGIPGQHDLPRELAGSGPVPGLVTSLDMITPTGKQISPVRELQAVAWVPTDQSSLPQTAAAEALREFEVARRRAFPTVHSPEKAQVGGYPRGSSERYADLADIALKRPAPFSQAANAVPAIIGSGDAYGPIFISSQFSVDATLSGVSIQEGMLRLSKELPGWFYLYLPDNDAPAQVINRGRVMYFIGK